MSPSQNENRPRRVAVIGGGITGLAAAHRLLELAPSLDVTLLEASDRLGGILQTERIDDFLVEQAADMFTTREPWALDLCQRIGFADQLIETNTKNRQAFIVKRGKLHPVPEGFSLMSPVRMWPVLTTPLLGIGGKLRLAWEYFTRAKKDGDDESLQSFAVRRLGRQAFDWIVQPLVSGIYTADPAKLSMNATMQQFVEMERIHGGLIRGVRKTTRQVKAERDASGARYGMFVAPRDGMGSFIDAIAAKLPEGCIRFHSPVTQLKQTVNSNWEVTYGDDPKTETFDAVIVAIGAPLAAKLLSPVDAELAEQIAAIEHSGAAIEVGIYRKKQFEHPLDGFGFVVPMAEQRRILACSFSSVKFAGRAPDDSIITRTFVGGACQPELAELPDEEVKKIIREELTELVGLSGEPIFSTLVHWRNAMPQYHVGHLERMDQLEARAATIKNLELAGNAYRGVGIPFCVRSGEEAAERVVKV